MKLIDKYLNFLNEAGFTNYPKGWDKDSVKKFANTLSKNMKGGPKSKGWFDKCVNKMKDKMPNPEGFCASVRDEVYGSTGWRGKDKSPEEVRKDVKKAKFKLKEYEEVDFIERCRRISKDEETLVKCLTFARTLCNKVCQQKIDREIDQITNNYQGSGEK